jgi:hypothetical protein
VKIRDPNLNQIGIFVPFSKKNEEKGRKLKKQPVYQYITFIPFHRKTEQ